MRAGWLAPLLLWGAAGCGGLEDSNRERRGHEPSFTAEDWPPEPTDELPIEEESPSTPGRPLPGVSRAESPVERACGADGVLRDSIRVSDQAELDALEGCERIAGDLTLRLFAGIDEAPLLSLHTVEGGLSVYGADQAKRGRGVEPTRALEGFRSLEQVGRLLLYGIEQLDLEPLGSLRRIGGVSPSNDFLLSDNQAERGLEISNCSGLESLGGLSALEHVEHIGLSSNPDLVSVAGLSNVLQVDGLSVLECPLLDLWGLEPLSVQSLSLGLTALTSLEGLGNAPRLRYLALAENAALSSLEGGVLPARMDVLQLEDSDALPNLKGLEGVRDVESLTFIFGENGPSQLVSLTGLERLETIRYFILAGVASLPDLSGLDALRRVEQFQISAGALRDLRGMPSLEEIDQLTVFGAPALSGFQGVGSASIRWLSLFDVALRNLAGLEQASLGNLDITQAPALTSLQGLPPLTTLGNLSIAESPALEDAQALAGLTAVDTLVLQRTGLSNLDALGNLRQLLALYVSDNPALEQMDALGAVTSLRDLIIRNNDALLRLPSFETSAPGTGPAVPLLAQAYSVEVADNQALTTLTGLSGLRSVSALSIQDNPSLVRLDLSSLERVELLSIRGNTSLDDTPLASLKLLPTTHTKIISNLSGPALLSPCPWRNDGWCDEERADCAAGTDPDDCGGF